jgi:hypothetical protein
VSEADIWWHLRKTQLEQSLTLESQASPQKRIESLLCNPPLAIVTQLTPETAPTPDGKSEHKGILIKSAQLFLGSAAAVVNEVIDLQGGSGSPRGA